MPPEKQTWYRPEIDGLRAVAVLPVLLFHGGFEMFGGGFIGVDVFFVISGYLITTILLQAMRADNFSFLHFYERRARRILPALTVVLLVAIPLSWMTLTPLQFKNFAQGLGATSLFSANILFWLESGYFEEEAEANPLLHMWSLAVEEQFYLFFPVVLLVLMRFVKRGRNSSLLLMGGFAVLAAASYGWMEWILRRDPSANFYLTPSRVWELIVGAFCAVILLDHKPKPNSILSAVGLAGIVWSILAFDETTAFPSAVTLIPVLGSALIVVFADPETATGRLLSLRPIVAIGLISYSTYLWHQPLFVFARLGRENRTTEWEVIGLIALSLLLGYLSWRFIEQPFRKPTSAFLQRRSGIFALAGLSIIGVLGLGGIGHITEGMPQRFSLTPLQEQYIASANTRSPAKFECQAPPGGAGARSYEDACVFGSEATEPEVVIFGDSHAVELAWELGEEFEENDASLRMLAFAGCGPFDDVGRSGPPREKCAEWSTEMFDALLADDSIDTVIVSYKMMYHLTGSNRANYPDFVRDRDDETIARMQSNTRNLVNGLVVDGKRVIFVRQAPETPRRPVPTVYHFMDDDGDDTKLKGVPRAWWNERTTLATETLAGFDPTVQIIDPADSLCDSEMCYAGRDGVAFYRDDNHMSLPAAELVAKEIVKVLSSS